MLSVHSNARLIDYLIVPLTIFNVLWLAFNLLFVYVSGPSSAGWGAILFLLTSIVAVVFNWVQFVILSLQGLEEPISRRRLYILRIVDTGIALTIGFSSMLCAIYFINPSQFTTSGVDTFFPSNPWHLAFDFVCLTSLLTGGIGFGPYIPKGSGSLAVVFLCSETARVFWWMAGAVLASIAIKDYKDSKGVWNLLTPTSTAASSRANNNNNHSNI